MFLKIFFLIKCLLEYLKFLILGPIIAKLSILNALLSNLSIDLFVKDVSKSKCKAYFVLTFLRAKFAPEPKPVFFLFIITLALEIALIVFSSL